MTKALTAIDLFCGAGGLSEGFRQAGFHVLAGQDYDDQAGATFAATHPEATFIGGPIQDVTPEQLCPVSPVYSALSPEMHAQIRTDALYSRFAERQAADVSALRRDEMTRIPDDFDYGAVSGLSGELASKLVRLRPSTLAMAAKIEGMTPAALVLLLAKLRRTSVKVAS